MAIALEDKTNTIPPTPTYPYGDIKNDSGSNDGTPVDQQVYGDFHQFFAVLMASASMAFNGLRDNAVNGFQYIDALAKFVRLLSASETESGTAPIATQALTNSGVSDATIVTPLKLANWFVSKFGAWFASTPTISSSANIASTNNISFRWKIIGKTVHCRYNYGIVTTSSGGTFVIWDLSTISTPILGLAPQALNVLLGNLATANTRNGDCRIGNGSDYGKMVHTIENVAAGGEAITVSGTITFEIA